MGIKGRTIRTAVVTASLVMGMAAFTTTGAVAHPRDSSAGSVAGSGLKCAKTAQIVGHHGHGSITIYGVQTPNGAPFHGKKVTRHHAYQLNGERITLSFGTDRYRLSDGTIFSLGCSGEAVGDPAVMPSLNVLRGTIRVHTTATRHGSVFTEEALMGTVAGASHPMSYTVTRTTKKKHLTLLDKETWFAGYRNQPAGTSTVASTSTPNVNVTPYVGSHHGTCRVVRSAKLVTKGTYGRGTAKYHF